MEHCAARLLRDVQDVPVEGRRSPVEVGTIAVEHVSHGANLPGWWLLVNRWAVI
jgi:hypothetical protein